MLGPLFVYLASHRLLSSSVIGSVNVRNAFEVLGPLPTDTGALSGARATFALHPRGRYVKNGTERDWVTTLFCRDADSGRDVPVWRSVFTDLVFHAHRAVSSGAVSSGDVSSGAAGAPTGGFPRSSQLDEALYPPRAPADRLLRRASLHVGGSAGVDYARLCGDCNPIHVWERVARAAGYDRCIAHALMLTAFCCDHAATAHPPAFTPPYRISTAIRRPVLLNSEVEVLLWVTHAHASARTSAGPQTSDRGTAAALSLSAADSSGPGGAVAGVGVGVAMGCPQLRYQVVHVMDESHVFHEGLISPIIPVPVP